MAKVELKPQKIVHMSFWIVGTSPLIQHAWDEKAKTMMREKHAGKKTKTREKRDSQAEAMAATYRTKKGEYGIPGMGLKRSLITAAHKDLGIEKTLVRKAIFLVTDDPDKILPMECSDPEIREDMVRVGQSSADMRYRPMFDPWSAHISLEVDGDLLTSSDVVTLVDRAGFGVGLCEWRPEKNGEFGRFKIDTTRPLVVEEV